MAGDCFGVVLDEALEGCLEGLAPETRTEGMAG